MARKVKIDLELGQARKGRNLEAQLAKALQEEVGQIQLKVLRKVGIWWKATGFKQLILGGNWIRIPFLKSSLYKKMTELETLARMGVMKSQLDGLIENFANTFGDYKNTKDMLKILGPENQEIFSVVVHPVAGLPSPIKMSIEGMPRGTHKFLSLEQVYSLSNNPDKLKSRLDRVPRVQEAGAEKGLQFPKNSFPKTTTIGGKFGAAAGGLWDVRPMQKNLFTQREFDQIVTDLKKQLEKKIVEFYLEIR